MVHRIFGELAKRPDESKMQDSIPVRYLFERVLAKKSEQPKNDKIVDYK